MKIVRIIAVVLLTCIFSTLAYLLYQKQTQRFTFQSFRLPNATHSILVPNLDRLLKRIEQPEQISELEINPLIDKGFELLWQQRMNGYNSIVGPACYLSITATDFNLVFKDPSLSAASLVERLNDIFACDAQLNENRLTINGSTYFINEFGLYTAISSIDNEPHYTQLSDPKTNADYLVFRDSINFARRIIAYHQFYTVWNDSGAIVKGRPIEHVSLISRVPKHFESLSFYGSGRFGDDKSAYFNSPLDEAYSWVNGGMVVFRKGAYEIMMAPQNDQRDLKLMLEEQAIALKNDTLPIAYITVKNFEIMPFESTFNWEEEIPALSSKLSYYTEFENFNVLANSLDALQWYLAEIQTGNLLYQDEELMRYYLRSTPLKTHLLELNFDGDSLRTETVTWLTHEKRIHAKTEVSIQGSTLETPGNGEAIAVPFIPQFILPMSPRGASEILVVNPEKMALIGQDGQLKWQIDLGAAPLFSPSFIDLENDGKLEIAVYTANGFTVYDREGKLKPNLNIKATETLKGGMCVNYDMAFDYRFFLVFANRVVCYNEQGQVVSGWNFSNVPVPLTGAAFYTQINGVDFLTFKDVNSKVHLLNRRGENRFGPTASTKLPNESDFVIGQNEQMIHKLGYANQYIYTRFLKDGYTDSLKLDLLVNAVSARWIFGATPVLVIEEPSRILLFNTIGYLEQEILKPQNANRLVEVVSGASFRYVFFNSSNNSLYLLNKDGRLLVSSPTLEPTVFGLNETHFYTFDGQKINVQTLK